MDYYSPLRYPGGKGKVANYFKSVFKENLLYDGVYVEPYAGGASVGLSLLFNQYASSIIINDIDKSIYAFWYSVLNKTEQLCRLIQDTEVTFENWQIQKEIQIQKAKNNLLTVGFSTFFLNRTNRSGILNAGVIGGKAQTGEWKIDARYNKRDLINRIQKIAEFRSSIELYNLDAVDLIKRVTNSNSTKTLFYFDPPYYVKGKDLYLNFYKDQDHQKVSSAISKIKNQKWIVTYDSVPQIEKLYSRYRQVKFNLSYSAGKSSQGEELMIFSNDLFIPQVAPIKKCPS